MLGPALSSSARALVGPCVIALAITGCEPPPSFELRWTVDRTGHPDFADEGIVELTNPSQCSRVGVTLLQLLTYEAVGEPSQRRLVAYEELPCFPRQFFTPGDTVGGPNLQSGEYVVGLRAVQNTPSRHAWLHESMLPQTCLSGDPDDPSTCPVCDERGTACPPGFEVCDCQPVVVSNDEIPTLEDFVLVAPHECEDGIDGDRDGLVDQDDPGCIVDPACEMTGLQCPRSERRVVQRNTLAVQVRVLGVPEADMPSGACASLGIDHYGVALERQGAAVWQAALPCRAASASDREFTLNLAPDVYDFVFSARDGAGVLLTEERRMAVAIGAGSNTAYLELWGEDFAQPISGSATIVACEGTDPAITHMRVNVVGPRRQPVNVSDTQGNLLDGTTVIPCETRVTEPLTWGTFAVEATLLAGDVPCFDNLTAPTYLWPATATALLPPSATGASGCPECLYDVHCGSGQACVASQCQG